MLALAPIALALAAAAPVVRLPTSDELRTPPVAHQAPAASAPVDGGAPGFRVVSGTVERLDWDGLRLVLTTASGSESFPFDRNTSVYLEDREGTLVDLKPGLRVRASIAPGGRTWWVEVARAPAAAAPPDGGAPAPQR
jgi:hypothetical protein